MSSVQVSLAPVVDPYPDHPMGPMGESDTRRVQGVEVMVKSGVPRADVELPVRSRGGWVGLPAGCGAVR